MISTNESTVPVASYEIDEGKTVEVVDMVEAIQRYRQSRIKVYPCHTNRASALGHECLRYLVYLRTSWAEAEPVSPDLKGIFDDGNLHERDIVRQLNEAGVEQGFEIFEQQLSLGEETLFKKLNITGHVDWKIRRIDFDEAIPVEFKSINMFDFEAVNSSKDFMDSKKPWLRKYVGQFMLYLLMTNNEYGVFFLKNKNNSKLKQFLLKLDYEFAESLLEKARIVNKHIEDGTVPERIEYCEKTCGGCSFKNLCSPPVPENSMYIIEKPEFAAKLDRLDELEKAGKEFKALDKEVKDVLKESGHSRIECGNHLFECKISKNGAQTWKRTSLLDQEEETAA